MKHRLLWLLCLLLAGQGVSASGFTVYRNERFGYSLKVPAGLSVVTRAQDGSGQTWRTGTVRLAASGANNPHTIKPHEYFGRYRHIPGGRVLRETESSGEDFYALEIVVEKNSRTAHHKIYIAGGAINALEFSYDSAHRAAKEPLANATLASFRPGNLLQPH